MLWEDRRRHWSLGEGVLNFLLTGCSAWGLKPYPYLRIFSSEIADFLPPKKRKSFSKRADVSFCLQVLWNGTCMPKHVSTTWDKDLTSKRSKGVLCNHGSIAMILLPFLGANQGVLLGLSNFTIRSKAHLDSHCKSGLKSVKMLYHLALPLDITGICKHEKFRNIWRWPICFTLARRKTCEMPVMCTRSRNDTNQWNREYIIKFTLKS